MNRNFGSPQKGNTYLPEAEGTTPMMDEAVYVIRMDEMETYPPLILFRDEGRPPMAKSEYARMEAYALRVRSQFN